MTLYISVYSHAMCWEQIACLDQLSGLPHTIRNTENVVDVGGGGL